MISWLAQRRWRRLVVAPLSGVVAALGFQPFNLWPLLILATAALTLVVMASPTKRGAFGVGYLYGVGFLGLGVGWLQLIFLQAMIGLVVVQALFFAALAVLLKIATRVRWWPLLAAASWIVMEAVYTRFPFGGFGWLRLGYAMADSPLAWGFPLFGVAGVGFLTALVGQLVAWLVQTPVRPRAIVAGVGALGIVAVSAAGLAIGPGPSSRSVDVGWVQGGAPGGGVYGLGPARTITRNQTLETIDLVRRYSSGELAKPDFIVWPENGTDMDPFRDPQTAALVNTAVDTAGVPILVGAITEGPGPDERQTVSLWWDPQQGVLARYIKRGIVPFGEWVPYRDVLLPLIPELKYAGAQSVAGTEPGVLHVTDAEGRPVALGVIVCLDLAFDNIVADTVTHGGQVMLVQSSNAMFQGSGQIDQQFAITRVRAMEARREMLVTTTSGVSGLIAADGHVVFQTSDHSAASGVVSLPLRDNITPAMRFGGFLEAAIVLAGIAGLAVVIVYGRMSSSSTQSGATNG